jgi:Flp pilus assembly protein TadG
MRFLSFWRRKEGSVAMEFAILLPVFVLFLWGILQFGFIFYLQNDMINAARESGRQLSVNDTISYTEAENIADAYLADWPQTFEIGACPTSDATTQNTETWSDGSLECPAADLSTDRVFVEIRADMADGAVMADIFGFFTGRTMNAYVEFRKEGVD